MSCTSSQSFESIGKALHRTRVDDLVERLYSKVGHDSSLSLTDHVAAGRILCRLRDHLTSSILPTQRSTVKLIACGTALHRRFAVGECGSVDIGVANVDDQQQQEDLDESRELVRATASRLFVLLCVVETERRTMQIRSGMKCTDMEGESRRAVETMSKTSVWDALCEPSALHKRQRTGTDEDTQVDSHHQREPVVCVSSAEIARYSLCIGASCLSDESWQALDHIMPLFFRHSAFNMAESLLMPEGNVDHLSLGTATLLSDMTPEHREKKLLAIVQAGESEAGQQVTRDLVLSFLLPSAHVGVRRTLLLTRSASTQAGVDHPTLVSRAHDVAMAGTEWIWMHGTDPLERMCCLLAGVAVLTTKGDEDPIRKVDAFCGRVALPFLETRSPRSDVMRMALVPRARRWILFRLNNRGMPAVAASQYGFEGLCNVVLQLVASLR